MSSSGFKTRKMRNEIIENQRPGHTDPVPPVPVNLLRFFAESCVSEGNIPILQDEFRAFVEVVGLTRSPFSKIDPKIEPKKEVYRRIVYLMQKDRTRRAKESRVWQRNVKRGKHFRGRDQGQRLRGYTRPDQSCRLSVSGMRIENSVEKVAAMVAMDRIPLFFRVDERSRRRKLERLEQLVNMADRKRPAADVEREKSNLGTLAVRPGACGMLGQMGLQKQDDIKAAPPATRKRKAVDDDDELAEALDKSRKVTVMDIGRARQLELAQSTPFNSKPARASYWRSSVFEGTHFVDRDQLIGFVENSITSSSKPQPRASFSSKVSMAFSSKTGVYRFIFEDRPTFSPRTSELTVHDTGSPSTLVTDRTNVATGLRSIFSPPARVRYPRHRLAFRILGALGFVKAAPDPAPSLIEQEDGASTSTSSRDGGTDSDTDAEILMHSVGRGPPGPGKDGGAQRLDTNPITGHPYCPFAPPTIANATSDFSSNAAAPGLALSLLKSILPEFRPAACSLCVYIIEPSPHFPETKLYICQAGVRQEVHTVSSALPSSAFYATLLPSRPRRHMLVWSLMSGSESDDVSPKEKTERLPAFQEHSPVYRGADLDAERTKVAIIQFALATICGEYLDDRCVLADMHDALADERCRVCRVEELEAAVRRRDRELDVELRLGESSARGVRAGNASAEAVQYATQCDLVAAQLNTLSAGHADQLRDAEETRWENIEGRTYRRDGSSLMPRSILHEEQGPELSQSVWCASPAVPGASASRVSAECTF
ncbi:hypothetical protein BD626DRAFT_542069 [Schizophyllum amplum]|uniref:Uncharacterized protein n=1 Tax=Schizophyllum amplum TaxID=97359 RepID=A0A550BSW6_9AGAR|nr:hypothetical protein BD626DRAFT_542069 [Auriculariopsis ampla]